MKFNDKINLNNIKLRKRVLNSICNKNSIIKLFLKEFKLKKKIDYFYTFLFIIINLIIPVFLQNVIRIKIVKSGGSGQLINESFIPNEMLINNELTEFTNIIEPEGQEITLIWNRYFTIYDGMFFINKTILNQTNSIIEKIDLSDFNTKNAISMKNMFLNQTNLKYINMNATITKNVRNFYAMFGNCTSLEFIDLSSFQFQSDDEMNMNYMFWNCHELKYIIFPPYIFYFYDYLYMSYMFANCSKLESIDLSNFRISEYVSFAYMFYFDFSLRNVKLPYISTTRSVPMNSMFDSCSNITSITFNGNKIYVYNAEKMFNNCNSLISLDLSKFNLTSLSAIRYMFNNCYSLKDLKINFYTYLGTRIYSYSFMFNNCSSLYV